MSRFACCVQRVIFHAHSVYVCIDCMPYRARYLLHLSVSYHTFQLTSRGHLPQETGKSETRNWPGVMCCINLAFY